MTNKPQSIQLGELERAAELATNRGRTDEARRLWQQVLQLNSLHPRGLGFMAQLALMEGRVPEARAMLEQAVEAAPKDAVLWLLLARAYRDLGNDSLRLHALERALVADPYCYPAMLEKAALLEQNGRKRFAAKLFGEALKLTPPDDALPRDLSELASRARAAVAENAGELDLYLRAQLKDAAVAHLSPRVEECLGIATGNRRIFNQEASVLLVPWLPAIPFYDRSLFPWLAELEAATDAIREEYLAAARELGSSFKPYVSHPEGAPVGSWAELNHSPRWNSLHLWKSHERFDEICRRCPRTVGAVTKLPQITIENFAPTVLFSVLAPHTRIPAHSSVSNCRLVVHLPLIIPGKCAFRVGNITREWKEGESWVFDDTINHEAWNDSDDYRVILMIDIWNPLLTEQEKRLIPVILNGRNAYYAAEEARVRTNLASGARP